MYYVSTGHFSLKGVGGPRDPEERRKKKPFARLLDRLGV
jgi:hypothetical protein